MNKNRIFLFIGLAIALSIAAFLSPFASKNPDGLDRVAQDLKFEEKVATEPPAKQLPFSQIFDEYSIKVIPKDNEKLATALAGVTGTLVVFGLAWAIGKLTVRNSEPKE
ncbi:MAG: PDGLE domain-containing protein [Pseudanabaena sp.]|uniref:PDGLE domain-containing protein n=1 Tax=Pseudanabaena mucicola TaxID=71190 RepID=UPI000E9B1930|nr:PDGLE domain-containing protein [Pseudanabaena sp. M53BS1SP1A06MG]MCA6583386.1 PDGLE domain-containing protein [Pseudanabaena sp. M34BS1SP1A06MG]MCA6586041.1 PDGLE domain-containing protein [Pseudanabaena sp. M051S1SP1A06QC]MCA6587917.1 PDGLE domain-containing protein [Pseudanabaena sp. M109S1SP1A06QC]MCA6592367.1 PDGLE domain-containing protein [Pseudanabaena sp. M38BS1SP1A06MG]MCA6594885.1 PDGLE domain-containing protein [Pseudanabaena sp. M046S1SP1A06QC]MCA6602482.1 PDGLE domain-contain